MGNCLVTKLKGVVDNPNLPKICSLIIPVTASSKPDAGGAYYVKNAKACQIIANGGYVGTSSADLSNHKTSLNIEAGRTTTFWVSNGSYSIEITEKYSLIEINANSEGACCMGPVDTAEFKYCTDLSTFGIARASVPETMALGGPVTGKLSDLSLLTKMVNLSLNAAISVKGTLSDIVGMAGTLKSINLGSSKNITGTLAEFGPFIHLEYMDIYNANIFGTFESFVQAQCEAGRTSYEGLFSPGFMRHGRSFGGQEDNDYWQYLSWESASKMYIYVGASGTGISATTKVYVKGYTDGEIATKTASGGIWEGKEVVKVDA
jgi:hypothetical protein